MGILVDSGLPKADVQHAVDGWDVDVREGAISLKEDGDIDLIGDGEKKRQEHGWDRLIYVTDMPLTDDERPVVSISVDEGKLVVISTPAFGVWRARARLREELCAYINPAEASDGDMEQMAHSDGVASQGPVWVNKNEGFLWPLVQLAGMIRVNQPHRMLAVMSGSFAAAAASGGFGVFFGSIWNLAESMSWLRLFVVAVASVLIFSGWLIVRNGLWMRMSSVQTSWRSRLDNAVTTGTVLISVTIFFLIATVAMVVLGFVVIPVDYLDSSLEGSADIDAFVRIGWMSAVMGTFAGAIGSNFDKSVEIRSATYSVRDFQRRECVGAWD